MFECHVDQPRSSARATSPASAAAICAGQALIKTKLIVDGLGGMSGAALTPKLPFQSFAVLREQIEAVLQSFCRQRGMSARVSLVSLQYRDDDGDMVDLLDSTFDPDDFTHASRVLLLARVATTPAGCDQRGKISIRDERPRRRVLGERSANTLPSGVHAGEGRAGEAGASFKSERRVGKGTTKRCHERLSALQLPSGAPAAAPSSATTPSSSATMAATASASPTPQASDRHHPSTAARGHRVPQATTFVFRARAQCRPASASEAASSSRKPSSQLSDKRNEGDRVHAVAAVALPAIRSKRVRAATPRPSWNNGNLPAWEEAEQKKMAVRMKARARILRKRAMQSSKKGTLGADAGNKAYRVIRRAKRDCRVTDARRERLGKSLYNDSLGSPPPALGKRSFDAYRELSRAAAMAMKCVPVPDAFSMPKRGRGSGQEIFPRTAARCASLDHTSSHDAAARGAGTTTAVVSKGNSGASKRSSRLPSKVPAALRPPPSRPGDIGFRGGVGFRMRPPSAPPARLAGTHAGRTLADVSRGSSGARGSNKGAASMTAAAIAKVNSMADPPSWSGRLRSASRAAPAGGGGVRKLVMDQARTQDGVGKGPREGCAIADAADKAAAAAIMARLGQGGSTAKHKTASITGSGEGDLESLQEQVALLKVAAGVSDEELAWRLETAKPGANAYRIASAALDRAETTYERLLWRQGQMRVARALLTGKGSGGTRAASDFAAAMAKVADGSTDEKTIARLRCAAEKMEAVEAGDPTASKNREAVAATADRAAEEVRSAARRMAKVAAAVELTVQTGSEVDSAAVIAEASSEAGRLATLADTLARDLESLGRKVEQAVGQVEAWQQRRLEAPEFAEEEAAREEAWSEANRDANQAALRKMRALLPEAVWDMNAADIQAAAAAAASATTRESVSEEEGDRLGHFYPSDLCIRLRECRPLHWLVSAAGDIANANFLVGEGAVAFTQLEGLDVVEMRALWCVLPREFARDAGGKKAEWRSRFRAQLEGLARQQEGATISAGWDPVRKRRASSRVPPLPTQRARHPAYFYPGEEATRARLERLRAQARRLEARKARVSALEAEITEAKSDVDSACTDARSADLRQRFGAETLRSAREAAKEALAALVQERKSLVTMVAENERTLSTAYPSLDQLESEATCVARLRSTCRASSFSPEGEPLRRAADTAIAVPGAFSAEPELRRRAMAAAKKLTPAEERALRAAEVQKAVSARDATPGARFDSNSAMGHEPCESALATRGSDAAQAACACAAKTGLAEDACCLSSPLGDGVGRPSELACGAEARHRGGVNVPPRRRVQASPAVLEFLTKEFGRRAPMAGGEKREDDESSAAPVPDTRHPAGTEEREKPVCSSASHASTGSCAAAALGTVVAFASDPPPRKPMSKTLLALVKHRTGATVKVGGFPGEAAREHHASPALGFLEELKARAAGGKVLAPGGHVSRKADGPVIDGREPLSSSLCSSGEIAHAVERSSTQPRGVGGRSFLDELRDRTTLIS